MIPAAMRFARGGAVLFDLDGTLLDTAPDFRAVLHDLCEAHGIDPPSDLAIHATVSSGARALTALAFNLSPTDSRIDELNEELLARYARQIMSSRATIYPGMEALLDKLEGSKTPWGVVTNKPERFSIPLLKAIGLDSRCSALVCPDHVTHRKPHPEPLLLACRVLDQDPSYSVYVGDHPRDIESGNSAGMLTIAAAYGYLPDSPPITEWGADLIAITVNEIDKFLFADY
jgi:N-acetyl-D-muramate 6-phosphate phosphatase